MPEIQVGSPEWWLKYLHPKLTERWAGEMGRCDRYYLGEQPLEIVTVKYREAFGQMLAGVRDNWMALVVDSVEERLHVDGFRLGDATAADRDAQRIWQENGLDADSEILHRDALTCGVNYAMVWFGDEGRAEITIEHPAEVIVAYVPGSRRKRAAALKAWRNDWTGTTFANVYLPDAIHKFESSAPVETPGLAMDPDALRWKPLEGDAVVENPLGIVPVVEFRNRPTRMSGRSEIIDVLATQDQINKLVCDMLVASEYASFRQRWATGLEVERNPDTGEPILPFKSGIDRVWAVGDPEIKFGEFAATDLSNYTGAFENRAQSIASRTRTPPHYLLGSSGSFPSGESLRAAETGLVAKVKSRQRHFGESWEEVIRLAGLVVENDGLAQAHAAETIWRDPEYRTEAEHVDALVKLRTLGVPLAQLWSDAGYSPATIAGFRDMLLEEALNRNLAAPTGPPANAGV